MADPGGTQACRVAPGARLRVSDAARGARTASERARRRRSPPPRLRAVRRALVPVLAPPPPGESGNGRHHRARDRRSRARPLVIWAAAEGCRVTLADGREVLDLTGGFGV